MNQLAVNRLPPDHDVTCAELINMAQRELAALFRTVTELFGAEQAELSAEDWLQELQAASTLPTSTRQWRLITAKVITQLANRCSQATAIPAIA
jgi:hypothetical protein